MSFLRKVRLRVPAGTAKPGPAIGQALGPLGLNMMEFCKTFNAQTAHIIPNTPMQVSLSAFSNRTFTFKVKSPPTSWFLKRCAGVEKGAAQTLHETVGTVHIKHIYEIAKVKQKDAHLWHIHLPQICRMIYAQCASMGLAVEGLREPDPVQVFSVGGGIGAVVPTYREPEALPELPTPPGVFAARATGGKKPKKEKKEKKKKSEYELERSMED